MCVVSMIMDHYNDRWAKQVQPWPYIYPTQPQIPQEDVDEFYRLLERAREYDKRNNEPDCELKEKKDRLQKLAKELGVEIQFPP